MTLVQKEPKKIYIWIDERTTYYIDLAWSSATAVTDAWWTFNGNSTPSFNSVWAYWSWARYSIAKDVGSLSDVSQIKITTNFYAVTGWRYWDFYCWSCWSANQLPNKWYMGKMQTYNGGSYRWIMIAIDDNQKQKTTVATPTWDYTWVTEIDLTTWVITYTMSWAASWAVSYTMTSSELNTLKSSQTYLWAWFEAASSWSGTNGHKIKNIKIELY
jgi:hypothetical protein